MSKLQPVRGTKDFLSEEARRLRHVEEVAFDQARLYGFSEIITPIFEFTEVFARTLGDTSDIVTKEMYSFADRGGESLTLRPEGTAGVARALISEGLTQNLPLKLFYRGPMFRYERPQKGRHRQFNQVGVELLGPSTPQADIEVIALAAQFLDGLGLAERVVLEINSLGDTQSRQAYRQDLIAFLRRHEDGLSPDSKQRLERNPLRILDSKDAGDQNILGDAPLLVDYLNDESRAFFDRVTEGLDGIGTPFTLNPRLVRGLDYYCHTTFEFTTEELGAQSTVLAGGRYDGLVELMGGPDIPGVGWAAGVERLALMSGALAAPTRPIAILPLGERAQAVAQKITQNLRRAGICVDMGYSGNLKKRLKRANAINARVAVMLGDDELEKNCATLRDLDGGDQTEVPLAELEGHLARYL